MSWNIFWITWQTTWMRLMNGMTLCKASDSKVSAPLFHMTNNQLTVSSSDQIIWFHPLSEHWMAGCWVPVSWWSGDDQFQPHCSNSYIPCKCQGPSLLGRDVAKLTPAKTLNHPTMLNTTCTSPISLHCNACSTSLHACSYLHTQLHKTCCL